MRRSISLSAFSPRDGETVSIGLGLPMFIRGMSETVKAKIKHFGLDSIEPGDILLTNDAYITGSHLNHFTFTAADLPRRRACRVSPAAWRIGPMSAERWAG